MQRHQHIQDYRGYIIFIPKFDFYRFCFVFVFFSVIFVDKKNNDHLVIALVHNNSWTKQTHRYHDHTKFIENPIAS